MIRRVAFSLVLVLSLLIPLHARAVGVWDPNDVRGPYDLRWVGATNTSSGRVKLTVTFYGGFDPEKLPHREVFDPGVFFRLDDFMTGFFWVNSRGDVRFSFGDTAGLCCRHYPVAEPEPRTLVVRYDPVDEGDRGYRIGGHSRRGARPHVQRDRTRTFFLSP